MWRSEKEAAPIKRGGIKQVYFLASLKTQRECINVARGLPFAERDPREARERAGKDKPRADEYVRYSAAALNLL